MIFRNKMMSSFQTCTKIVLNSLPGYICFVAQERNWVIVEGLNCKYRLEAKDSDYPGYMAKEEKYINCLELSQKLPQRW